ncbi:Ikbke [Symbiodinium sp. CCMP2456]|nr:Ikbke [Symbiodinium sp. CCMP2456]
MTRNKKPSEIAELLNRDTSTLTRLLCMKTAAKKQGRPEVLSDAEVDMLERRLNQLIVKADGRSTVTVEAPMKATKCKASRKSVLKALHKRNIEKRVLTPEDVKARLAFAKKYGNKTRDWWLHNVHALIDGKHFEVYRALVRGNVKPKGKGLRHNTGAKGVVLHVGVGKGRVVTVHEVLGRCTDLLRATVDPELLAASLANVICFGSNKTARVPMLAGITNVGKSMIFDPVVFVFCRQAVDFCPALGASMALSSLATNRSPTVPPVTFKKLFAGQYLRLQVSQANHDGNPDFKWSRGAAMTAPLEGLWDAVLPVSSEDVCHTQSRIIQFEVLASVGPWLILYYHKLVDWDEPWQPELNGDWPSTAYLAQWAARRVDCKPSSYFELLLSTTGFTGTFGLLTRGAEPSRIMSRMQEAVSYPCRANGSVTIWFREWHVQADNCSLEQLARQRTWLIFLRCWPSP